MSFRINRVYTRSGDSGETGLVGGRRVSKSSLRVRAYGDVDEFNAFLGLAKEHLSGKTASLREVLEYLQQELFDLGSELATAPSDTYEGMWRVGAEHVSYLEKLCDHFGEKLPELESFILPGGSELATLFHVARTVARRAERSLVALSESAARGTVDDQVTPDAIRYLNRVSDLCFVLARFTLAQEKKEVPLWTKPQNRKKPV